MTVNKRDFAALVAATGLALAPAAYADEAKSEAKPQKKSAKAAKKSEGADVITGMQFRLGFGDTLAGETKPSSSHDDVRGALSFDLFESFTVKAEATFRQADGWKPGLRQANASYRDSSGILKYEVAGGVLNRMPSELSDPSGIPSLSTNPETIMRRPAPGLEYTHGFDTESVFGVAASLDAQKDDFYAGLAALAGKRSKLEPELASNDGGLTALLQARFKIGTERAWIAANLTGGKASQASAVYILEGVAAVRSNPVDASLNVRGFKTKGSVALGGSVSTMTNQDFTPVKGLDFGASLGHLIKVPTGEQGTTAVEQVTTFSAGPRLSALGGMLELELNSYLSASNRQPTQFGVSGGISVTTEARRKLAR